MRFDIQGLSRKPASVTVNGHHYAIGRWKNPWVKHERLEHAVGKAIGADTSYAVSFRGPTGAVVQIKFHDASGGLSRTNVWILVGDKLVTDPAMRDTAELSDPGLRAAVETALRDLGAAR